MGNIQNNPTWYVNGRTLQWHQALQCIRTPSNFLFLWGSRAIFLALRICFEFGWYILLHPVLWFYVILWYLYVFLHIQIRRYDEIWYICVQLNWSKVRGARIQLPHTLKQAGWDGSDLLQQTWGFHLAKQFWVWRRISGNIWVWEDSDCWFGWGVAFFMFFFARVGFKHWDMRRFLLPKVGPLGFEHFWSQVSTMGQEMESHVVENTSQRELKSWDSQIWLSSECHGRRPCFFQWGYLKIII